MNKKFRLQVVKPKGMKEPFMRGILTHSLVQRNMPFKKAYKIAQDLRDKLSKRDEILSSELKILVNEEIIKKYGVEYLQSLHPFATGKTLQVISNSSKTPFSKALLAQTLTGAGIPPNHAHPLAQEIEMELQQEFPNEISNTKLKERVHSKILGTYGDETAQLYLLSSSFKHLDKPVIIYITGAGGTGKSTFATELAARLGILKVTGTDMIRQVMRLMLTPEIMPSLHFSSYEAGQIQELAHLESEDERILSGFTQQALKVCVGVNAVVERAIKENISIIIEGVHLLPEIINSPKNAKSAYHIPILLSIVDSEQHLERLSIRSKNVPKRSSEKHKKNFPNIRLIHDYFLDEANEHNIEIINNTEFDTAMTELIQTVMMNLQKQIGPNSTNKLLK